MRGTHAWAQAQRRARRGNRFVVPAGLALSDTKVSERGRVHRIAANNGLLQCESFVEAADVLEKNLSIAEHAKISRIERHGTLEVLGCAGVIVFPHCNDAK